MILVTSLFGCATMKDSLLLGASIGATTGGVLGNTIGTSNGHTTGGTVTGALAGAALGSLIAYSVKKNEKPQPQPADLKSINIKAPSLSSPEVRRIWVPAKIEGNKYIDGHYEFIIEHQSVWTEQ